MQLFCALILLFISSAMAVGTPQNSAKSLYAKALGIAQSKVIRDHAADANRAGALATSSSAILFGRPYQKGDSWQIAVWRINQAQEMLRPNPVVAASELRDPTLAESGLFRFKVVNATQGATPTIEIEITQLKEAGFALIDPVVDKIVITGDRGFRQLSKHYYLRDRSEPVEVSPNGVRMTKSIIDLLPLDFISIDNAVREELRAPPRLPKQLREFARKISFAPDPKQSVWLEQDDFFGRPIQALWQHGNPWPSYIRTANGIALLVKKEDL